jgi:uncharacterized membrane protein
MHGSTVHNSAVMDSQVSDGTDKAAGAPYSVRGGIRVIQAAIVLLVGLLLPIPPIAIDALLAVNLVFTAMLLFVLLFAREPADIVSVPLVVIFVTLLRLGTNVAAARSVFLIADAGRIIDWCGAHIYYGLISILAAVVLIILISVLICKAAGFIRHKAISYLVEIIPTRQANLQAEFQAGTITHDQLLRAKNRVEKQIKFFAGMVSTSFLLLFDGILTLIITLSIISGAMALGIMRTAATVDGSQQYQPLAMAIAMTTAVPAALVALALRLLINRRFLITLKVQSPLTQTIQVTSRFAETQTSQGDSPAAAAISDKEHETIEAPSSSDKADNETAAEFADQIQALPETGDTAVAAPTPQAPPRQMVRDDRYYNDILAAAGDKPKASILLAGQNTSQLPVTVAVELMIHIVKLHKKGILIDMDSNRNAVAAAFDIDVASMQGKAVPTGIGNLWISPADDPDNPAAVKLTRKVKNALKVFDYVVIYAPNLSAEKIPRQLVGACDAAVIFGTDQVPDDLTKFVEALSSSGCPVMGEHDLFK